MLQKIERLANLSELCVFLSGLRVKPALLTFHLIFHAEIAEKDAEIAGKDYLKTRLKVLILNPELINNFCSVSFGSVPWLQLCRMAVQEGLTTEQEGQEERWRRMKLYANGICR